MLSIKLFPIFSRGRKSPTIKLLCFYRVLSLIKEILVKDKTKLYYAWDLTKGMMILITVVAVISIFASPGELAPLEVSIRLILALISVTPIMFAVSYVYVFFKYEELLTRDKELEE